MKEVIKAQLQDMDSNMWGYHFRIPQKVEKKFVEGNDRRVICTFNGEIKHHCAIMPSPEGAFVMLNKALVKKLKLQTGDYATLEIEKDTSKYGMPIAEEFELVIFGDEEVAHYFEQLTPGKQRNLIHLVNKIKSSDIKINRSMAIATHLKETKGEIEFKLLNETIKEFNRRMKIR